MSTVARKPGIPDVPRPGQDRYEFDRAIKECLETIMGRRVARIEDVLDKGERWQDMLSEITPGLLVGANAPTWKAWNGGLKAAAFDPGTMNEIWFAAHILHNWKFGTPIFPHFHWTVLTNNLGTVRFGLEFSAARGHSRGAFPVSQTIYVEQAYAGDIGGRPTHMIAEVSDAQALLTDQFEPDTLINFRLFRDAAHVNDTQTADVFIFYADCHHQIDQVVTTSRAPLNGLWYKNLSEPDNETVRAFNELLDRLQ